MTQAQKHARAEFRRLRGWEVRGPFVPLLRSPELLSRTRALGDYLRFQSPLAPALRELVILITARRWSQPYEWEVHYTLAVREGLSPSICDALAQGVAPKGLSEDEQAIYDFCAELLERGAVGDATYERARARFDEATIVDVIGLVGYYTLLAMVLNVARTPLPDDVQHVLPAASAPMTAGIEP